jgi:hypothetical protein
MIEAGLGLLVQHGKRLEAVHLRKWNMDLSSCIQEGSTRSRKSKYSRACCQDAQYAQVVRHGCRVHTSAHKHHARKMLVCAQTTQIGAKSQSKVTRKVEGRIVEGGRGVTVQVGTQVAARGSSHSAHQPSRHGGPRCVFCSANQIRESRDEDTCHANLMSMFSS